MTKSFKKILNGEAQQKNDRPEKESVNLMID